MKNCPRCDSPAIYSDSFSKIIKIDCSCSYHETNFPDGTYYYTYNFIFKDLNSRYSVRVSNGTTAIKFFKSMIGGSSPTLINLDKEVSRTATFEDIKKHFKYLNF